ncbi:16S rRNA (adenine(1518)-N(6)/adenine(1519)-N(6))-dimethyltransferase RsmA [Corynebacterium otitidis]|uniref:Ribosomal RNA small subunit methyltransferase A n=1 Tax=Corynebacterium otitidis ATCC 51513 TaxID=883169 RepID=I7LB90_9CORY|nr:16S rRNA (adenine(1518)-N(6)/adenine(1519)-N(6))-dimethyltransferase RsmA [Corynebacterium otitidis]EJZ82643.1 dimethyladenosine transferase [Corynebacterium otitidis ATCC 51513]KKO83346.1 16S rRNA methyltransferase [Corynebacterium otitidis]CCI82894.1 dimethyladenosine transferase [Corynebacterium otitidis ATCC 51513]
MEGSEPRLLGPAEIRELADALGLNPTKRLGQNFVHDANTVRRIVAAAGVGEGDHVVEVGPGLGSLTLALLGAVGRVTAVEIDTRLAELLPRTAEARAPRQHESLSVIRADALTLAPGDVEDPTALVANLPYNVSVPVLIHLLETFPTIKRVLVMVQAEVAERLAATPGSKAYGVPSVKAAFYGDVARAGAVGKNVFWPAPKVASGLVRLERHEPGSVGWEPGDAHLVFPLVDAAFAQRRKTLRAALSGSLGSAARAEEALAAAGIDPKLRGEALGVESFVALARAARDLEQDREGESAK